MIPPLMISSKDDALVGVANRSDPMGVRPVWSTRARNLVPHLTEQTTDVRAFQILVEAFRLWQIYAQEVQPPASRLGEFFMLVEQAFARTIGHLGGEWPLPGARRVRARRGESPCISIADRGWHLLGGQLGGGIWGLYRGASVRAGLLDAGMAYLSEETREAAESCTRIGDDARRALFDFVRRALDGQTVALPTDEGDALCRALRTTFDEVPLKRLFRTRLIDSHGLNRALAERLVEIGDSEGLDRRAFLTKAASELPEYQRELQAAIDCEDLLVVVEGVFYWLCCRKGETITEAAASLPDGLIDGVEQARSSFPGGSPPGHTANSRLDRLKRLETADAEQLVRSVVSLHDDISKARGRAPWVWLENEHLQSDADVPEPSEEELTVGWTWRNDYYLWPLRSIARQLRSVGA